MKIFVVSHQARAGKGVDELSRLLSQIATPQGKATQVVLVDQLHNESRLAELASAPGAIGGLSVSAFRVENFLNPGLVTAGDSIVIDQNLVARKLRTVGGEWASFDFEQHLPVTMLDLIRKVARFCFMSEHLASRSLILIVPDIYLSYVGRCANEAFNNLPVSPIEIERSAQTKMLLMSAHIERVIIGLPLLTRPLLRLQRNALQVYRRLIRAA